jgi:hypothetical protein
MPLSDPAVLIGSEPGVGNGGAVSTGPGRISLFFGIGCSKGSGSRQKLKVYFGASSSRLGFCVVTRCAINISNANVTTLALMDEQDMREINIKNLRCNKANGGR